jgi:hypothetical protein
VNAGLLVIAGKVKDKSEKEMLIKLLNESVANTPLASYQLINNIYFDGEHSAKSSDSLKKAQTENSELTTQEMADLCRQTILALMGSNKNSISVRPNGEKTIRVSYKRPSDGQSFKHDCQFRGNRIVWRGVDIVGNSPGPGRWRDTSLDEQIFWRRDAGQVRMSVSE